MRKYIDNRFESMSVFNLAPSTMHNMDKDNLVSIFDSDSNGYAIYCIAGHGFVYLFGSHLFSNVLSVDELDSLCDELNDKYYTEPEVTVHLKNRCDECGGKYGLHVSADLSGIPCTLCSRCDDGTVSLA